MRMIELGEGDGIARKDRDKMKRDIKQKTLREQRIKPRLGFGGDGWLMTFLSMNDNRANRTIEFVCSHGERFELELSANPKHKSFIALHLRWKPLPAPPQGKEQK